MKQSTKRLLSIALALLTLAGLVVPASASSDSNLKDVLNRTRLHSVSTGVHKYDEKLASILGEGTTYEKVRRGYRWLAENMTYDKNSPRDDTNDALLNMAYGPLFKKRGSCKSYSAATYYMLRYLGLPGVARVNGTIVNSDGTKQVHCWNVVTLEGIRYIVDAEVEGKVYNRSGGDLRWYYFFANPATYKSTPRFTQKHVLQDSGKDHTKGRGGTADTKTSVSVTSIPVIPVNSISGFGDWLRGLFQ